MREFHQRIINNDSKLSFHWFFFLRVSLFSADESELRPKGSDSCTRNVVWKYARSGMRKMASRALLNANWNELVKWNRHEQGCITSSQHSSHNITFFSMPFNSILLLSLINSRSKLYLSVQLTDIRIMTHPTSRLPLFLTDSHVITSEAQNLIERLVLDSLYLLKFSHHVNSQRSRAS